MDSLAGKQTQDLSIKLEVLYQLSYQGIHASPLNSSHYPVIICVFALSIHPYYLW